MNQAQELFTKIQSIKNTNDFIDFCTRVLGPVERIHFDFKEKRDSRDSTLHDNDRKNLAKAVSGFANSGGGVLIWGIEDKTIQPKPITDVKKFIANLLELAPQVTDPIATNIDGYSIESDDGSKSGYGILFVPESVLPPHRVALNIDEIKNHYFVRSGSMFSIASHTMLEDMFGRRPKPNLTLSVRAEQSGAGGRHLYFMLILGIENNGRGSAKSPFLAINVNKPYKISEYGIDGNGHFGLSKIFNTPVIQEHRYGSVDSFVIHPGVIHDVTAIKLEIDLERLPMYPDVAIDYKIAAEGIQIMSGQKSFKIDDLFTH